MISSRSSVFSEAFYFNAATQLSNLYIYMRSTGWRKGYFRNLIAHPLIKILKAFWCMIHPLTLLTLKTTSHNVSQIQIKLSHTFRFLKALKDSRVHALVIINRKEEKRKKAHTPSTTHNILTMIMSVKLFVSFILDLILSACVAVDRSVVSFTRW